MAGVDDERRLYECARKYQIIVKQFDQLIELIDNRTAAATRLSKRRRKSYSSKASNSSTTGNQPTSSCQQNYNDDEAFVQTITRFLHELRTDPAELNSSTCSRNQD